MFIEKPFLRKFLPSKGFFCFRGVRSFCAKMALVSKDFRENYSNCLLFFFWGGELVGNFSHRFENCGQTPFEKHGLDKETEERDTYI